jgi:hypothetical protein
MEELKALKTFNKDKSPSQYLGIVRALLKGEPVKKIDILRKMGVNLTEVDVSDYNKDYFSRLNKAKVIKYDAFKMAWVQGPNYQNYLNIIFQDLLSNESFLNKFSNYLVKHDSNSINYILELNEME